MMRFIWIGDQIQLEEDTGEPAATDFAFWNTCINCFVEINTVCVFHSVEDFVLACKGSKELQTQKRLLGLIPDKLFAPNNYDHYLTEIEQLASIEEKEKGNTLTKTSKWLKLLLDNQADQC